MSNIDPLVIETGSEMERAFYDCNLEYLTYPTKADGVVEGFSQPEKINILRDVRGHIRKSLSSNTAATRNGLDKYQRSLLGELRTVADKVLDHLGEDEYLEAYELLRIGVKEFIRFIEDGEGQ